MHTYGLHVTCLFFAGLVLIIVFPLFIRRRCLGRGDSTLRGLTLIVVIFPDTHRHCRRLRLHGRSWPALQRVAVHAHFRPGVARAPSSVEWSITICFARCGGVAILTHGARVARIAGKMLGTLLRWSWQVCVSTRAAFAHCFVLGSLPPACSTTAPRLACGAS